MAEKILYTNPLYGPDGISDWIAEGPAKATAFTSSTSSTRFTASPTSSSSPSLELTTSGDFNSHFTLWCPIAFPSRIRIAWDFSPTSEPGLAMLFFGAASASSGGSIFSPDLAPRTGEYPQYHSGDIRTLHVSYFRRRWENERAFHTCNLRKSPGFHLVAQGADPLPPVVDARGAFYRVEVVKDEGRVEFSIDGLRLFEWVDDGAGTTGPVVGGGRIGFRQMAPLVARYRNLVVTELPPV